MTTSPIERLPAVAQSVFVTADTLGVELIDGRTISVPLEWYPRLAIATAAERQNWVPIGRGEGIHWPDVDEDISVANLLAGSRSGESQRSYQRWLEQRSGGRSLES